MKNDTLYNLAQGIIMKKLRPLVLIYLKISGIIKLKLTFAIVGNR